MMFAFLFCLICLIILVSIIIGFLGLFNCLEHVLIKLYHLPGYVIIIGIVLILWPLLSFSRYLYLDSAIDRSMNGPIAYDGLAADVYKHPSQSVIESTMLNTHIFIHNKDYMISFPIVCSKANVQVRWLGDIIIRDEYDFDRYACFNCLRNCCIGHCLYFNVWVYLILVGIILFYGIKHKCRNQTNDN